MQAFWSGSVHGLVALAALFPGAAVADWRLAYGFDASTGEYGLPARTDVAISYVEAGVSRGLWNAQVTVPYLAVEGPANLGLPLLPGDGAAVPSGRDQTWGLGDVRVGVSRFFPLWNGSGLLDVSASVKVPTADADRLLGTGEPDVSLRTDYIHDLGSLTFVAGVGYTFSGRSDQFDVQDRASFSVGLLRDSPGLPTFGVSYAERQPIIDNLDNVRELSWSAAFPIGDRVRVVTYALTGLSDATPDYGLGFRITYRFSQ
ncbi:MAG: hypothetical protein AAGH41_08970 [Pseudomonadota bacterium]